MDATPAWKEEGVRWPEHPWGILDATPAWNDEGVCWSEHAGEVLAKHKYQAVVRWGIPSSPSFTTSSFLQNRKAPVQRNPSPVSLPLTL